MDLVVRSYEIASRLPHHENFGLISQIRRAAVSIPANVAEGHGRRHTGDYVHHLSMARGSLLELETHLLIATRLGYLESKDLEAFLKITDEVGRMISGLILKLRTRST